MTDLKILTSDTKESFGAKDNMHVNVTAWSNHEGVNIVVTDEECGLRMAGAMRWEEMDILIATLLAARSQ